MLIINIIAKVASNKLKVYDINCDIWVNFDVEIIQTVQFNMLFVSIHKHLFCSWSNEKC